MTLNPQALETAISAAYIENITGGKASAENAIIVAIQAYLAALPKVDEDYMCEKLRCAAADCDIRLEIDQQRYILKAIMPLIRGK